MSRKIQVGIIGGAGFVGGEIIRLLVYHPGVIIRFVQSSSQSERLITDVHRDISGDSDIRFTKLWYPDVDVLFLCGGNGRSRSFLLLNNIPASVKVIDLSQDFRSAADRNNFGRSFIYGLTEFNRRDIAKATSIANPGCFATAIALSLIPVAGIVTGEVHIHAITGATGAGHHLSPTVNFNWRDSNVSVYKPFSHQHLAEINETLLEAAPGFNAALNFLPVRGNFTRGILTAIYFNSDLDEAELLTIYNDHYRSDPFIIITATEPDLKQVINTNKIMIFPKKHGRKLLIVAVLDNLLKGAAGQAIQNMNVLFKLDETMGLKLKGSAF